MAQSKNFADWVRAKLASDADLAEAVESEEFEADVATEIYQARIEAKLTQRELANLVGTQQSVIARMEGADYGGHSISMLRRIAKALGKKLHVGFYAERKTKKAPARAKRRS